MAEATAEKGKVRVFKPSIFDRFKYWVKGLPIPSWLFYIGLAIVMIMVQVIFLWLDGGVQADQILPIIVFNGLLIPFALGLIHLLDNQAVKALNSIRPVLDMSDSEFNECEYKLSNMPSTTAPFLVGLSLVILLVLSELFWTVPIRYSALGQMPVFATVYHIIDKTTAFLMGVFLYHTLRQLYLVTCTNSRNLRINLFNLGPLQAFSRVTALTGVGLILGVYGWMLINPDLMTEIINVVAVGIFTVVSILIFVLPLYRVHGCIEAAKDKELHEIDLRFEATFSKFNKGFREDDYSAIEKLNATIASLEVQRNRVEAIHTWPWKPEIGRFALSVIAIPLILTILRLLVMQVLGW